MRADDWIVDYLVSKDVTDVFGIPGVVVMDFLYAVDRRQPQITPHLNYHEQGAAFAACGYAQATGKLGVAYATRGPGFTNMLTAMADAYYDSVPTMFITAHSTESLEPDMRVMNNQEIDTVSLAKSVTKKAVRIDRIEDLQREVVCAYQIAISGRPGPVFIDFYNALFSKEVDGIEDIPSLTVTENNNEFMAVIEERIRNAERPIILIGNGARSEENKELIKRISEKNSIPVLSSRGGQDIVPHFSMYYGFVGSRATRYSNFILSKADLIIALGNRMAFPIKSKSFLPIVENAFTIRVDVDNNEFIRSIPNSISFNISVENALKAMNECYLNYDNSKQWIDVCDLLKQELDMWEANSVINNVMEVIRNTEESSPLVCDVGNHSFWVSTAYTYQKAKNRIMYSGSFGTLGSALPKSIGAYYATRKPTICFTGDQGIQFNIQELQFISMNRLPIVIVILNNTSSGMIMEREVAKYGDYLVHTTVESGYGYPNFEKVASCYEIDYIRVDFDSELKWVRKVDGPLIVELMIDKHTELNPSLPVGKSCQDLSPELPRELYSKLNNL